ncbi:MAG: hypothetical protein J1D86_00335 [Alistipes sp.]|nr:hypothetical protein [Alistipes sp.]
MDALNWKLTTKKIYQGVLLFSLCGVAKQVLAPFLTANAVAAFANGSSSSSSLTMVNALLTIAIIAGYVLFFLGIQGFQNVTEQNDVPHVKRLYVATILLIISYVLSFIPIINFICWILNLVAFILMLLAYSALKKSPTFPALARKGASLLFIAMILDIVAAVFGLIPLLGLIVKVPLDIVAFVLVLIGWKRISDADVNEK